MSVVCSTVFHVKAGREKEFIQRWRGVAPFLVQQPGFVRVHLHRSLEHRGRFLPIAEWASQAAFREALGQPQLKELARDFPAEHEISLYETAVGLARPA